MNKKYISLTIVLLLAIGTLPALFGQTNDEIIDVQTLEDFIELIPENQCYQIKLLQSIKETLLSGEFATYVPPPGAIDSCLYWLDVSGRDLDCQTCPDGCIDLYAYYTVAIKIKNQQEQVINFSSHGGDSIQVGFPIPGSIWKDVEYIKVTNLSDVSQCGITYTWELNSLCPCEKGKQALYPKVDIEQFSVTGGPTLIKDGKILSGFEVAPGVQQTMIQIENRGFFTQNDAKVKFLGLPQGVTVEITPNTQKIKAHNLGTYQATFTVGTDVPSGTYKVAMIAYSDKGVFDTIQMDLIVP